MKRGVLLGLIVALLTGCVGYVHLGGRKSRPDVFIGTNGATRVDKPTAATYPNCPPYVFVDAAPLGALPDFNGNEPESEVIEILGRELIRTRTQYTDYVRKGKENYQAYLIRCASG